MAEEIEILSFFKEEVNSEQLNALLTAFTECGKDFAKSRHKTPRDNSLYEWLEKDAKNEIVTKLTNKLSELGYEIVKK